MSIGYAHLHSCLITYFIFIILHEKSIYLLFKDTKKIDSLKIVIQLIMSKKYF